MRLRAAHEGIAPLPRNPDLVRLPGQVQRKVGFEFETGMSSAIATPQPGEHKGFAEEVENVEKGGPAHVPRQHGFTRDMRIEKASYVNGGRGYGAPGQPFDPNMTFHALKKKEKIVHGGDFALEADEENAGADGRAGSNSEFVTIAFEETPAGRAALDKALQEIEGIGVRVDKLAEANRPYAHAKEIHSGGLIGKVVMPKADLWGALQFTAGVDLARINALMLSMAKGEGESAEAAAGRHDGRMVLGAATGHGEVASPVGTAAVAATEAVAALKARHGDPEIGSRELEGLVGLMASYLVQANGGNIGYAKSIATLMARTDFAQMFKMLPKKDYELLSRYPKAFLGLIERAAGGLKMDGLMFEKGIHNDTKAPGDKDALASLRREDWIYGVAGGVDYLTKAKFNENPMATGNEGPNSELESMGELGPRTEKVGPAGKDAPIFEERALGRLALTELRSRALDIFDFIVSLNANESARFNWTPTDDK